MPRMHCRHLPRHFLNTDLQDIGKNLRPDQTTHIFQDWTVTTRVIIDVWMIVVADCMICTLVGLLHTLCQ